MAKLDEMLTADKKSQELVCARGLPLGAQAIVAEIPQALHRQSRGIGADSAVFRGAKNAP